MTDAPERIEGLWEEYEAVSKSIGELPGGVEEYDIDAMNGAAWELYQYALRTQPADPVAAAGWQPIETAPKDGTVILAWCYNNCSGPCAWADDASMRSQNLCLYHAHVAGLSDSDDGAQLIKWGGGWVDGWEDGGGSAPDFWFTHDSEFERVANPTHWMPLPTQPQEDRDDGE